MYQYGELGWGQRNARWPEETELMPKMQPLLDFLEKEKSNRSYSYPLSNHLAPCKCLNHYSIGGIYQSLTNMWPS